MLLAIEKSSIQALLESEEKGMQQRVPLWSPSFHQDPTGQAAVAPGSTAPESEMDAVIYKILFAGYPEKLSSDLLTVKGQIKPFPA